MTDFGPIIGRNEVAAAVKTIGEMWLPTYLAEVGPRLGYTQPLSAPGAWRVSPHTEPDRWPEDALNAVHVGCAGTDGTDSDGEGYYGAVFIVNVWAFVAARDEDATALLGDAYTRAIRTLFIQHRSLGGFARSLEWTGEAYGLDDPEDRRTMALGVNTFQVGVDRVSSSYDGPTGDTPPGDEGFPFQIADTDAQTAPR